MRLSAHHAVVGAAAVARPAWVPAGAWRRCDPLTRLACAALEGLDRSALQPDTAVVVTTSYGAVHATLRFVDSIAEHGDAGASPTPFTSSVHNGTAGTVGQLLGLRGPCTTLAQGGTGCLAALRWAWLTLRAGRCDRVLVLAGEAHNDWSRRTVAASSSAPWPIADVCSASLITRDGPGRELRPGEHPATRCLDGAALGAAEAHLARAADTAGQRRHRAPDVLGAWAPTGTLAALAHERDHEPEALQLRERDGTASLAWWLGPGS